MSLCHSRRAIRTRTAALWLMLAALAVAAAAWSQELRVGGLRLVMRDGVIVSLRDEEGRVYAQSAETHDLGALRTLAGDLSAAQDKRCIIHIAAGGDTGEAIIEQSGEAEGGLYGIQWGIAGVPLDYMLFVPGYSGVCLDRSCPSSYLEFSYPSSWECQFVIIQGPQGGFYVWAEDIEGRYKRLRVWRRRDSWELAFETQNLAPLAEKKTIRSVRWRLGRHGPRWQDFALRYQRWAATHYGLMPLSAQQPAWIKEIRTMIICGLQPELLTALAERLDPQQTILYVPDWRRDGYDRNYPDYTPLPGLQAFLEKAHALGFRVMLHVNYFGCDPKNEVYEQFRAYHVRDPFSHQPLYWIWPRRGEPDIKFAYINPASRAWREMFVRRMKQLCTDYPVDALHLDQTLCIWNDDAGPIDGMTMLEGNIALHRELRAALAHVALSGEGLNEITCRYEAFAQRHVWGIHHAEGTYNRKQIEAAHPISAFIFRPFTILNGYLGMANPSGGALYAAWQQAYVRWGVIPTWKSPSLRQLEKPTGFVRQLLDEITFFQRVRLDPALDEAWPEGTLFPYRTAAGQSVRYVREGGGWRLEDSSGRIVSRTITGMTEFHGGGSIAGWLGYDEQRLFGLSPQGYYPWQAEPRDQQAFHIAALPGNLQLACVGLADDFAEIVTRDPQDTIAIAERLEEARCGYRGFEGDTEEKQGLLATSAAGASFMPQNEKDIWLHPPWKAQRRNPQTGVLEAVGTGIVYAVLHLKLPRDSAPRFVSEVYMDAEAVGPGKTDGIVFRVEAEAKRRKLVAERWAKDATPEPLELDLRSLAGEEITLRLVGDPGPQRSATFDWGRWRYPRLILQRHVKKTLRLVSPQPWQIALSSGGPANLRSIKPNLWEIETEFPGALFLLNRPLPEIATPTDLTRLPFVRLFVSGEGQRLDGPLYASAEEARVSVGGLAKHGFSVHPPDQGQTRMEFLLRLPPQARRFATFVGLRDGSKSEGCVFIVEITGRECARQLMRPGRWEEISVDLRPYAGQPVVLSLVTDANGSFAYDWGAWGEPRIE